MSAVAVGMGVAYTEAQLVVLVLAVFVIAVALLSYFVVAPEYEKRLHEQFAAFHEESKLQHQNELVTMMKKTTLQKHKSLGSWDMEAASSDDDAFDHHLQRLHVANSVLSGSDDDGSLCSSTNRPPMSLNSENHRSMAIRLTDAQRELLARRRKSESDALKHANVYRAEMLRRRVMLKKLEEEIKGAIKETSDAQQQSSSAPSSLRGGSRRLSNDALNLTEDRVKMLQEHPADCAHELRVLATQMPITRANKSAIAARGATTTASSSPDAADSRTDEVKAALQTVHDVLSFYLSVDHRDMTKLTVFCNSLLQHDGLNHLRAFEVSCDQDIRSLSTSIIEKAVPAIWH
uniref:Uncharacterized protein n=1 Tax=Globisporangium ultimum (strain ATCC 200006 / CBS 805.95 / DAOM BR144) TaxID=431595 RepID=K3W745_GLOUD